MLLVGRFAWTKEQKERDGDVWWVAICYPMSAFLMRLRGVVELVSLKLICSSSLEAFTKKCFKNTERF